ncbi:MAG: FAD-dependent oxidoreductase [Candidatus Saccharibacteria bacterium]
MLNFIDNLIDRITMYRLTLYYLLFLLAAAAVLAFFGFLPFSPLALVYSTTVLVAACYLFNAIFAKVVGVEINIESAYITGLILALIISPNVGTYASILPFLLWASAWAMVSKFIINVGNKHLFNPAAFAVALTSFTISRSASWWVGTAAMLPFALVGAFLIVRKLRRFDLFLGFVVAALAAIAVLTFGQGSMPIALWRAIISSPLIFFGSIMLTEPLTAPPKQDGRIAYGILVGALFAPQVHFGSFYLTPELALLIGNVFSFVISPKGRFTMTLKEKRLVGNGVYDFVFVPEKPISFQPGQYMEWTLGHRPADSRGNRRYFTLASSPTEAAVRLGVKFYAQPSSFKRSLSAMKVGETVVAGQLAGDFVLPKDPRQKIAMIGGGIGITPFRSMIQYLIDRNESRPIVLLYSNRTEDEIAYREVFDSAERKLGIRTVYTLTDAERAPLDWGGRVGYFTAEDIRASVPDYKERKFYISGSHGMVEGFRKLLLTMGVPRRNIVTDFFPGLA